MIVTEPQAEMIRDSFSKVARLGDAAGELFYQRLFETAPALREMFPKNISGQAAKLIAVLDVVAENISRFDEMVPSVERLGQRHVRYGVKPQHYDVVGQVLINVLAEALGDDFTPEVEAAWASAFTAIADRMICASYAEVA